MIKKRLCIDLNNTNGWPVLLLHIAVMDILYTRSIIRSATLLNCKPVQSRSRLYYGKLYILWARDDICTFQSKVVRQSFSFDLIGDP